MIGGGGGEREGESSVWRIVRESVMRVVGMLTRQRCSAALHYIWVIHVKERG